MAVLVVTTCVVTGLSAGSLADLTLAVLAAAASSVTAADEREAVVRAAPPRLRLMSAARGRRERARRAA